MTKPLLYAASSLALILGVLDWVGGRNATVFLTGAGSSWALGLAYLLAWFGTIIFVPPMLFTAVVEYIVNTVSKKG